MNLEDTQLVAAGVLEERNVGDISGQFCIRAYQRGYRWGADEVTRLLNDIAESRQQQAYYLQPVVVKRIGDGQWELVDGQQRLTTLYLIQQYIKRSHLPSADARYDIEYETRPGSQQYLKNPDVSQSGQNIDFFHIYRASECIRQWFEAHGHGQVQAALDFYSDLSRRVKVIWYEAPDETDSIELFTRLNVGRIPLNDAELVKALLLTHSKADSGGPGRSLEIAAQWDGIERDLRFLEIWAFVTGDSVGQATHISLLLDTIAGGPRGRERPRFHTFETLRKRIETDPQAFWNQVVDLHSLIVGWYEDRELFHKIGYLVAAGDSFERLEQLARDKTRTTFMELLDDEICKRLDLSESGLAELSYDHSGSKCMQVLLLMNVETIRRMTNSAERYSFQAHASGDWSLEHIHAQNAETLNTEEQWKSWLELHRDALKDMPHMHEDQRSRLVDRIDTALERFGRQPGVTQRIFRELEREVGELLAPAPSNESAQQDDIQSISNLALLDGGTNSVLSNSVFEVKRRHVLNRDKEGAYIPICTRNVFLKYYTTEGAQQIHFWGAPDRTAYLKALKSQLSPYFKQEEATE